MSKTFFTSVTECSSQLPSFSTQNYPQRLHPSGKILRFALELDRYIAQALDLCFEMCHPLLKVRRIFLAGISCLGVSLLDKAQRE